MTASMGHEAKLEVSEDGDTFIEVKGISDLSVSRSWEEHDRTTYDGSGKKDYDLGLEDCTLTLSAYYDEDDAGQLLLAEYADARQALYYRYTTRRYGARMTGRILVTSIDIGSGPDDASTFDASLRCLPLDYGEPSLDLPFAETLSLRDTATETYPVTFTRATSATYVGADGLIKTAAINEARFDHDPTTGESLGLLIEEQRTNHVPYSSSFAAWIGTTTYDANVVAPDGTLGAYRPGPSEQTRILGYTGSNTVSISFFVRPVSGIPQYQYVEIFTSTTGGSPNFASYVYQFQFDGNNPDDAYFSGISISEHTNGWLRVSAKLTTPTAFEASSRFGFNQFGYTTHHIWGVQFEEGAFPTSYIPTAGAAVTRNLDETYISGVSFSSWYNQTQGSFFAEYQRPFNAKAAGYDDPVLFTVTQGTSVDNRMEMFSSTASGQDNESSRVLSGGTFVANLNHPTSIGAGESTKRSMSYSATLPAISSFRDGGSPITNTSVFVYTSMDRITIGKFILSLTNNYFHNGTIKRIAYYRSRLPNLHLQTLTEP